MSNTESAQARGRIAKPSLGNRVRRGEAGQTLVLFVFALAVLCGFAALAIDVGLILRERSQLQSVADAAALAGAQELPGSPAVAVAQQYAEANGIDLTDPDYTFVATTPYQGDPDKIEVKVSREVDFLFGRVLGLDFADVPARAVAEVNVVAGPTVEYAFIALNADCGLPDQLRISGSVSEVIGGMHSNGNLLISGSDNSFVGPVTYSTNPNCSGYQVSGQNNTFTSTPAPAPNVGFVNYTFSSFPCTYTYTKDTALASRPEAWVGGNPNSNQLNPGVYCSTQDIVLSGQDITGNVTLVAMDEVKISGSDFDLTAYFENILAFSGASHNQAMDMAGSGGSWTGLFYAPNGGINLQGSSNITLNTSLIGDKIKVSGSDFTLTAVGIEVPTYLPGAVRLDE